MIKIKCVCDKCKKEWVKEIKYSRVKYKALMLCKNKASDTEKYYPLTLCPDCEKELEHFIENGMPDVGGWFAAYNEKDPVPRLITINDINTYASAGYKVVTLESYISSKKGDK